MLGCQDFCGYYEWSFHFVRRCWGNAGVELLWRKAIGGDSQKHYSDLAAGECLKCRATNEGDGGGCRESFGDAATSPATTSSVPLSAASAGRLRALYNTWVNTGEDEKCDWTFTLDEGKNVLRWDMRECPSKGFLLRNDLNADEDYCDHCMGWIIPMLEGIGAEIVEHEHNHCGQCWATMRMKDRPSQPLNVDVDIRNDPRWQRGYLDRWANSQRVPLHPEISHPSGDCPNFRLGENGTVPFLAASDASEMLQSWFHRVVEQIGAGPVGQIGNLLGQVDNLPHGTLVTDAAYNDPKQCPSEPAAVLIACPPADLAATAARYNATPSARRPLLLHAYLPAVPPVAFLAAGLPRPLPILPLLIRKNQYTHRPGGPHPTTEQFLLLLAASLGKLTA